MASLKTIGQTQLGKTGNVRLSEIVLKGSSQTGTDGFDRVYTTAANDYLQVNPFEVQAGDAPNPDTETAPYNLSEWEGYVQWTSGQASGTEFDLTVIDALNITFTWVTASGYVNNPTSLRQKIYVQTCSLAEGPDDCLFLDLLTLGAVANSPGDAQTAVVGLGQYGTQYVAAIYTFWDERGNLTNEQISDAAANKATLTLGVQNDADNAIYFTTGTTTTTTTTIPCRTCGQTCTGGGGSGCGAGDGQGTCCTGLVCDSILSECVDEGLGCGC